MHNLLNVRGNLKYLAWGGCDPKASWIHPLQLRQILFMMMDAIELGCNFLHALVKWTIFLRFMSFLNVQYHPYSQQQIMVNCMSILLNELKLLMVWPIAYFFQFTKKILTNFQSQSIKIYRLIKTMKYRIRHPKL